MVNVSVRDRSETDLDERLAPVPACWVCGGDQFVRANREGFDFHGCEGVLEPVPEFFSLADCTFWLQRCLGCGFMQPQGLPKAPGYFDWIYNLPWPEELMEGELNSTHRNRIYRTLLKELGRRLGPGRRTLLDVGSQAGRFILLAHQAGWQAEGLDLNPICTEFAARRTGLPVHRLRAQELAAQGRRYSAVTLNDVLEHIPEPVALLRQLGELLEPGGWVSVKVPCGSNQLRKERLRAFFRRGNTDVVATNLVHVNHFGPRSLRLALQKAGFSQVTVTGAAPELFPFPSRLRRWGSHLTRLGVYHLGRLLPGGVHTPLTFHLQAYGCKA
jgi:SAM-dependent methyltransferase